MNGKAKNILRLPSQGKLFHIERCMKSQDSHEVTALLLAWNSGDEAALDQLIPIVHAELHRLAHRCLRRETPSHEIHTTVLVNEAYLRLIDAQQMQWQNRAHFFAISARLMRRILVDFARQRNYQKRGGQAQQVSLDQALNLGAQRDEDLVALDDALNALAEIDPRKERVIELRFFAGLSVEETAEVLQVSADTVMRDWRLARVWLLRYLNGENANEKL